MKILRTMALVFGLSVAAEMATAVTIDFESMATGTYSALAFADGTITYTGGDTLFDVVSASPGPPVSGHALLSYYTNAGAAPFRVDFTLANITFFQIGVGDYNQDEDNTHLAVYDAFGNLLGSDFYLNPSSTNGGDYLSVATSTPIAYALFWDAEPFAGAVYWDNMTYTAGDPVPEPASLALLASGLGLLAARRRRTRP